MEVRVLGARGSIPVSGAGVDRLRMHGRVMYMPTEQIKRIVTPIAVRYGVERVSLFGSRARGEERENSDYDFVITKGQINSLLTYISFINALESAFGTHVDVVTDTSEDKEFIDRIQKDAVVLYEK